MQYGMAPVQTLGNAPMEFAQSTGNMMANVVNAGAGVTESSIANTGHLAAINEDYNKAVMDNLSRTFSQLPTQLMEAEKFRSQLPLMQAQAQTGIDAAKMGQQYLNDMNQPMRDANGNIVRDANGNPVTVGLYHTQVSGTNTEVTGFPYNPVLNVQRTPPPPPAGGTTTGGTTQQPPPAGGNDANGNPAPPAVTLGSGYNTQVSPPSGPTTVTPSSGYTSQSTVTRPTGPGIPKPGQDNGAVPYGGLKPTTEAQPSLTLGSGQLAQSTTPLTLPNFLTWYNDTQSTKGVDATAGINPVTGKQGILVEHAPKSGVGPQWVDPGHYQQAVASGWTPNGVMKPANTMLASPPILPNQLAIAQGGIPQVPALVASALNRGQTAIPAAAVPASAAAYQSVQDNIKAQSNGNTNPSPNPIAAQLAAGTLTPQQIQQAAGNPAQWAGTKNAPQAPLPSPTPYWHTSAIGPPTSQPPPMPPVAPVQPVSTPAKSELPPTNPTAVQDIFGTSAQEALARIQSAKYLGKDTEHTGIDPNTGKPMDPSDTYESTDQYFHPVKVYVDPAGGKEASLYNTYTLDSTPYASIRHYFDGHEVTVNNVIRQAQDEEMTKRITDAGYATGDLSTMDPKQKEALYRLADAKLNTRPNDKLGDDLTDRQAVIDAGERLQAAYKALGPDPKSLVLAYNQFLNKWGPNIGLHADPKMVAAQAAYANYQNLVREEMTTRPPGGPENVGVGLRTQDEFNPGAIGDLGDDQFGQNLDTILKQQKRIFSQKVDQGLASRSQIADSLVNRANLYHYGKDAVGSPGGTPIKGDESVFQKVPDGTLFQDEKTGVKVIKGQPGIVQ